MTFQSIQNTNITGLQHRNAEVTAEITEALDQYSTVMGSRNRHNEVHEPERARIYEVNSDAEFKKLKEEFQTKKTAAACNRLSAVITARPGVNRGPPEGDGPQACALATAPAIGPFK